MDPRKRKQYSIGIHPPVRASRISSFVGEDSTYFRELTKTPYERMVGSEDSTHPTSYLSSCISVSAPSP